jgi:hypothetical protein
MRNYCCHSWQLCATYKTDKNTNLKILFHFSITFSPNFCNVLLEANLSTNNQQIKKPQHHAKMPQVTFFGSQKICSGIQQPLSDQKKNAV